MADDQKQETPPAEDVEKKEDESVPKGADGAVETATERLEGVGGGEGGSGQEATSLQLENVSDEPKGTVETDPLKPVELLPSPLHLESHPADELHAPDSPTTSLISSLRHQLTLLSDQAQQLNTKLVATISRHADLEDQHFHLQARHSELESSAETLRKEKAVWEESMNTGLYVERDQVREEMQRLAAGLVEEERRRGSAEEGRRQVENDVDDLAASLFDQANTMVAQERLHRVQAEDRLKTAEVNLAAAEAAVRDMQQHLQSLPITAISHPTPPSAKPVLPRRFLSSHVPYGEFAVFLHHLRALRPLKQTSKDTFPPPLVTNLLAQPFLARAIAEDHDPTLRLDVAPDLSFFTRRTVSQAIIAGDLIIEPVSASTVIASASGAIHEIGCSLCGKPVFPTTVPPSPGASHFGAPPQHPVGRAPSSRFSLKPFFNTTSSPGPSVSPTASPLASPSPSPRPPSSLGSVYIFRVTPKATASVAEKEKDTRSYPLCRSGWCLERLRATCELWHFVRTGIIKVVWHGDDGYLLASEMQSNSAASADTTNKVGTAASPARGPTPVQGEPEGSAGAGAGADSGNTGLGVGDVTRRKSSWGLGFSKSGGWTKAFNRGSTASPPVSPGINMDRQGSLGAEIEPADEAKEVKQGDGEAVKEGKEEKEEKEGEAVELAGQGIKAEGDEEKPVEGLAAPLEIKEKEDDAEAEAETVTSETHQTEGKTAEDDASSPEGASQSLGPHSSTTSLEADEGFATPEEQEEHRDPIDALEGDKVEAENKSAKDKDESGSAKDGSDPAVDESAPTPTQGTFGSAPPPVPKRAAARNRASQLDQPSGSTTPAEEGAATPVLDGNVPAGSEASGESTEPADKSKLDVVDLSEGAEASSSAKSGSEVIGEAAGAGAEAEADATSVSAPRPSTDSQGRPRSMAPPLPPRHPRTPNAQIAVKAKEGPADGETAFLRDGDEAWEAKTWRQVIKLKEDMWRSRVGVRDGES